ncbi:MAG: alpha/beta hydrolase [Ruminococcaceae bacterium]|nr:alpha/beta hydrolase [Oscillospiraceae bacterium]
MISKYDIVYKDGLCLDLHLPESADFDLFVYFHGGGLSGGNKKNTEVFAKTLAKNSIATASVEYRMYPTAKFPDFIEDAACSVRWLKDNIGAYGKLNRIFVGGSSAGGYISMMLCFDGRYFEKVGVKPTDIDAYIHDAGQPTSHFNVLKEMGKDSRRVIVDETAPMFFVGTEEKYPPMLFIVSDNDMFGRYEQTMLMIKTLEHFGHKDNVKLKLMHSSHCAYIYKTDENGEGILGNVINSFIKDISETKKH